MFQQTGYEVFVENDPPRGLIAIRRGRAPGGANFVALHALDVAAAGPLCELIPSGFTIVHLKEEFPLALLADRAKEFHPHPAWLFRLDANDLVDPADDRVRPLAPEWAGRIAKRWQPDWPAAPYVRSRIEIAPTAAIYEDGAPVAWALTHMVTDRVGIIGMVHVLETHRRRGLAKSVVAAIARTLLEARKVPALHAYTDNAPSLALFTGIGFRKVKRQVWGDAVFR